MKGIAKLYLAAGILFVSIVAAQPHSRVNILLTEDSMTTDVPRVPSGEITFSINNVGPNLHEFLILRLSEDPDTVPSPSLASDWRKSVFLVYEIGDIAPLAQRTLTVNLQSGMYMLVCNMVSKQADGTLAPHYKAGMRSRLEVH